MQFLVFFLAFAFLSACGSARPSDNAALSFSAYYTEGGGASLGFEKVVSYSNSSNSLVIQRYRYAPGPIDGNFYVGLVDDTTKATIDSALDDLLMKKPAENYVDPTGQPASATDATAMTIIFSTSSSSQQTQKNLTFINTANPSSLPASLNKIYEFAASSDSFLSGGASQP